MKKRILAFALTLAMVVTSLSMLSFVSFATEPEATETEGAETEKAEKEEKEDFLFFEIRYCSFFTVCYLLLISSKSLSERVQNSDTESLSPLMFASNPHSVIASVISVFVSSPKPAERAFGRVFLLCSKAARIVLKKIFSSVGLQGRSR